MSYQNRGTVSLVQEKNKGARQAAPIAKKIRMGDNNRLDHLYNVVAKHTPAGDQVMSIVPVGNVTIQVPAQGTPGFVWELVEQIQRSQQAIAERILTESLAVEVERFLG